MARGETENVKPLGRRKGGCSLNMLNWRYLSCELSTWEFASRFPTRVFVLQIESGAMDVNEIV